MGTVEREAWDLLRNLVESLQLGPSGGLDQFLAVPLAAGGGLLARSSGTPVRVRDLALIDTLAQRGYVEVARTPHGLPIVSVSADGFTANLVHHGSNGLLPVI